MKLFLLSDAPRNKLRRNNTSANWAVGRISISSDRRLFRSLDFSSAIHVDICDKIAVRSTSIVVKLRPTDGFLNIAIEKLI
jgi:hypothetical protein